MSTFYIILFAILSVQFSVCHTDDLGEPIYCGYSLLGILPPIVVNCGRNSFIPGTCDHLIKENATSEYTEFLTNFVWFAQCQIDNWSDIFKQFPQVRKLIFNGNNSLPSAEFSEANNLKAIVIYEESATLPSSLSLDATNLESFFFRGNQNNNIDDISLKNATKLLHFIWENSTMTELPANLFENSTKLEYVHLPSNKIKSIDSIQWPISVNWIDLDSNRVKLTKQSLSKLENLKLLFLNANEINEIEMGTFSKLQNLLFLLMNENQLNKIERNTFEGLLQLEALFLANNRIEAIEDGVFDFMPNLRLLDLSKNKISSLNQHMFGEPNKIAVLNLAENQFREIGTEVFAHLGQLMTLNMSSGGLEIVDFIAFAKTLNLIDLDLSNNNISHLIKMVPNAINGSMIEKGTFYDPDPLKNVWPEKKNSITDAIFEWDAVFSWTTKRKAIAIRKLGRKWWRIETGFVHNCQLKKLLLSGNQLTIIEKETFAGFENLEVLILSNNPITTLYPESFAGLNELIELKMDHCKLTTINFSIFAQTPKIEKLDVSYNELITITGALVPQLHRLKVNDNQLKTLSIIPSDLPELEIIDIRNNDNNFTCSLCENWHFPNKFRLLICHEKNERLELLLSNGYC